MIIQRVTNPVCEVEFLPDQSISWTFNEVPFTLLLTKIALDTERRHLLVRSYSTLITFQRKTVMKVFTLLKVGHFTTWDPDQPNRPLAANCNLPSLILT